MQSVGIWRYVAVGTGSNSQYSLSKVTNQTAVSFRVAATAACFALCVLTLFVILVYFSLFVALVVASSLKPSFLLSLLLCAWSCYSASPQKHYTTTQATLTSIPQCSFICIARTRTSTLANKHLDK